MRQHYSLAMFLPLVAAFIGSPADCWSASYQKTDGTVMTPIVDWSGLGEVSYAGGDLEPFADLSNIAVQGAYLVYADLRNTDLSRAILANCLLISADLSESDLSFAGLAYSDFRYANLSYADLREAQLSGANFSYANLSHAKLSGAVISREPVNLSYADLSYADLSNLLLQADATGADLSNANLIGAAIAGWSLDNANLSNADFMGADVRVASLLSADLNGAQNMHMADWAGARYSLGAVDHDGDPIPDTIFPPDFDPIAAGMIFIPEPIIGPALTSGIMVLGLLSRRRSHSRDSKSTLAAPRPGRSQRIAKTGR